MKHFSYLFDSYPKTSKALTVLGIWFLLYIIVGSISVVFFDPTLWIVSFLGAYFSRGSGFKQQLIWAFFGALVVSLLFIVVFEPRHSNLFGRSLVSLAIAYFSTDIFNSFFSKKPINSKKELQKNTIPVNFKDALTRDADRVMSSNHFKEYKNIIFETCKNIFNGVRQVLNENVNKAKTELTERNLEAVRLDKKNTVTIESQEKIEEMKSGATPPSLPERMDAAVAVTKMLADMKLGSIKLVGNVQAWSKKDDAIDMAEAGKYHAMMFKELWGLGEGLKKTPTDLIEEAALAIFYNQYVLTHGGFFMKRAAKQIITQIEAGMLEAKLSTEMALRLQEISEESMGEE